MITTPLSRLADILNVNISSMNRADAQDAVCAEAEKNIRAHQHRINQLHSRVDQTERENAELRARLDMIEHFFLKRSAVEPNMKAGCVGEFEFSIEDGNVCPECWNNGHNPNCEFCAGKTNESGYSDLQVSVPWTTQKDIFKRMWAYKAAAFKEQTSQANQDRSITDTDRLDYLDSLNKEFNKRNNSNYGWEIGWNHNRIALHDIGPMGMSVRQAIDEHRERFVSNRKTKEAEHD